MVEELVEVMVEGTVEETVGDWDCQLVMELVHWLDLRLDHDHYVLIPKVLNALVPR